MFITWKKVIVFAVLVTVLVTIVFCLAEHDPKLSNSVNTTDYWLPKHVKPKEYSIHLVPYITPNNFTFDGVVKINAEVNEETSKIVLHADEMKIHEVNVSQFGSKEKVENITRSEKYQFLNLFLKSPVSANTNISIEIAYTGKINSLIEGFFRNSYKVGNETRWMAATQLQATSARQLFPCFDEPALKAIYHISVKVPENYTALSNMPAKSVTKDGIFTFESTPPMSTYLVAVVVSEFTNLSLPDRSHPYGVWSNPELANQLPYALSIMPKMIDYFERHLGVPYTLPKLDMVAVPDFPGVAMENWGLHVYSELCMLYDKHVTPLGLKRYIRGLITHEIAHQWFGNLVSPKSWDYTWLNEGFAEYFEYHAYEDEVASWNLESIFVAREMIEAFAIDATSETHPITNKVYSTSEIDSMFDTISYNKAACIIRMLQKLIGSDIFFAGLSRYLKQNQYSIGTPELLFEAIEDEVKASDYKLNTTVAKLMNSWTLQPGYPVVEARLDGNKVTFKQRRFFIDMTYNNTDNAIWVVPLTWATRSQPNFTNTKSVIWLTQKEQVVTIQDSDKDWIIFNVQLTGFYRVNYDAQMWHRIVDLLKSGEHEIIHEDNRASLMDDLFNLGRAGMASYDLVLTAVQYLANETNYVPWKAASPGFTYLKKRLREYPEVYKPFKKFVISLLEPHYQRLGYNEVDGEKDFDVMLREIVLRELCSLESEDCVKKSFDLFEKLQVNNSFHISPNQQYAVYCAVSKHGTDADWNYLSSRFEKSNYAAEKYSLVMGLACTTKPANLQKLLENIVTPQYGVKKQDIKEIFAAIPANSGIGLEMTLDFIGTNYKKVLDFVEDESDIQSILESILEYLSTDKLIKKFSSLIEKNEENMTDILESLQNMTKNSIKELEWNKKNTPSILKWLGEKYP